MDELPAFVTDVVETVGPMVIVLVALIVMAALFKILEWLD